MQMEALAGVQPRQGLVEHDDLGVRDQGLGHTLTLWRIPLRERADPAGVVEVQLDEAERRRVRRRRGRGQRVSTAARWTNS